MEPLFFGMITEPWQVWGGAISLALGSGLGLLTAHWQLRRQDELARRVSRQKQV